MIGHGLTALTDNHPNRWDEYLAETVFSIRTRSHAVTGYSPFFLLYGVHPRLPKEIAPPRQTMAPMSELERQVATNEYTAGELDDLFGARRLANQRTRQQADRMRR
ncbi:hypothetical protein BASA50_001453 [Batrachochytrium salamandrivorans]|uniref:Uncharacterized protein n=1 Tax=Batrachochytrium salamandrivorans TaxID=1357716 RepID=A0ABQ8FRR9_9FUNG|nr:hypothetical protein BASA60_010795 [Batrachochytrium salamandrivorans]KAH6581338.1 hypothetical protein BASA61_009117 [Batrachochytrium salamandrivorans]KAH6601595.1 hypothetical protein BASA50_001453 [Batrachochytrium salamandrivorans]KAH9269629.1 hypothetical protein BASA83_008285 [Batrachochytrium salamandrivorans]